MMVGRSSAIAVILLVLVTAPTGIFSAIVDVQSPEYWNYELQKAGNALVVAQFKVTWCPYCRMMKPVYQKLAEKHPNVTFLDVDAESQGRIAWKYGIRSVPTYKFIKNGIVVDSISTSDGNALNDLVSRLKA